MPPLGPVLDRSRWALVPPADQPVVARINGWLARIAWFALAGAAFGLILVPVHPDGERDTAAVALIATIAGLATVLLGRLATAALAWPQRRTATGVLLVSLVLWAIGGWAGGQAGRAFESGPEGRAAGIRFQTISSVAVLLILILMIWKPGA